jgi:hypothetical protein
VDVNCVTSVSEFQREDGKDTVLGLSTKDIAQTQGKGEKPEFYSSV